MNIVQPNFKFVSRTTVTTDCLGIYAYEKIRLKDIFAKFGQRVCLTTDLWTSLQNILYMCLTAYFIDKDWKIYKRIINFCVIPSHKSKEIGKVIELCLLDWGIEKLCTLNVDNASSNDVAVEYLKNKFSKKNG